MFYIQLNETSLANGIATIHPELHEFVRDTFNIKTCLSTPLNFPLNMDTTPENSSAPSHLYPLPPQFTNIAESPHQENWLSHKTQQKNKTFCIHHQADISIISHCKRELLSLAKNEHRGILFIETKNLSPILDIPRRSSHHVEINHICSIPPHTIHWTNFKGESINPDDKNKEKLHGWSINWNKETQQEEITSPEYEGRWDTPRSSSTPLN